MNPKRLAQALNTISVGFAEAAEALSDMPSASVAVSQGREVATDAEEAAWMDAPMGPPRQPEPSLADESVDFATPQGHEAICPKHHVPYTDGQYGPYCKQATDDPAWGKQKGDRLWCRITPKNAAEYLRIKAAA